jgi:hypothetical protein
VSEMIERVAAAMKAMCAQPLCNLSSLEPVLVGGLGDAWPYIARAAIAAMREPSNAMVSAAEAHDDGYSGPSSAGPADAETHWKAMIDAALKP